MSIIDTEVVDAIGTMPDTNLVVLSISDHLEWGDQTGQHLLLLQNKINTYLRFVESGEVFTAFPSAQGKKIAVRIYFKHEPDDLAKNFLEKIGNVLCGAGFELQTVCVG